MVEHKLKNDVIINGMQFKAGTMVNIPLKMVNQFEKETIKVQKEEVDAPDSQRNSKKKSKKKFKKGEQQWN